MSKRILIVLLFLLLNSNLCFAVQKISKTQSPIYREETITAIDKNLSSVLLKTGIYNNTAVEIYQKFLKDKNNMSQNKNFISKLEELRLNVDSEEFMFYMKLLNIVKKYVNVDNDVPATDYAPTLLDFLYNNYMKKYNITNAQEVLNASGYIVEITNRIDKYIKEISEYNYKYEKYFNKTHSKSNYSANPSLQPIGSYNVPKQKSPFVMPSSNR